MVRFSGCALVLLFGVIVTMSVETAHAAGVAPVQLAQADQVEKKAPKQKQKRECRRVRETGSRIATRVCKKPREWARVDAAGRESVERSVERANRNTGTASSQ